MLCCLSSEEVGQPHLCTFISRCRALLKKYRVARIDSNVAVVNPVRNRWGTCRGPSACCNAAQDDATLVDAMEMKALHRAVYGVAVPTRSNTDAHILALPGSLTRVFYSVDKLDAGTNWVVGTGCAHDLVH